MMILLPAPINRSMAIFTKALISNEFLTEKGRLFMPMVIPIPVILSMEKERVQEN
jgi:hypothetical protein